MKKTVSLLLCVLLVFGSLGVSALAVSEPRSFLTDSKTPVSAGKLKFSKKLGQGFVSSPTTPVVVGNTLIVAAGKKLFKLDAQTGGEIKSASLADSVGFAVAMPLYADGKIFVQLDGGKVQAFDYKTMKSLWLYTDGLGGQGLSPLTYDSGFVYTGFWLGETQSANFVCLSAKDEDPKKENERKKARWSFKRKGGFYMAGAAVTERFILVGCDDGEKESGGNSLILSLNKANGKLVSSLKTKGDLRSSVTYDGEQGAYFIASKAGFVYRFKADEKSGKLSALASYKAGGSVTSSPAVYGGRVYFGCQSADAGKFIVLNAKTMKKVYDCEMPGFPQSAALIGTGYDGRVYIYMTYNKKPGGIIMFADSPGQTEAKKTDLFSPTGNLSQFCVSSVTAGSDGTLYYKNDSGNIFAVTESTQSVFVKMINAILHILLKLVSVFAK